MQLIQKPEDAIFDPKKIKKMKDAIERESYGSEPRDTDRWAVFGTSPFC